MGKKVILTEKQFKEYLRYQIIESIVEGSDKVKIAQGNKDILAARNKLLNQIQGLYRNNSDYRDTANKMGFADLKDPEIMRQRGQQYAKYKTKFTTELKKEILWAAKILRKYTDKRNFQIDFNALEHDYPQDIKKILGIKEFIDMKGLSKLYYPKALTSQENIDNHYYGFDDSGNLTDKTFTLDGWFRDPKKYNDGDETYYDDEKGKTVKTKLDIDDPRVLTKMRESFINRYMTNVYGMGIDIPEETFVVGNHKLSDTTLIVNFTSAMRCPAWNECLLKEVCYARDSEKQYGEQRDANTKKNLMWEAGHRDPEILKQIFTLLRLFVVDYAKCLEEINSFGKEYTVDELSQHRFGDFDEKIQQIFSENKRITDIRLNENGDFIGQWLIDAFDVEAGDFLKIGVNTSAYTCRNLDFSRVQNLIINCSNRSVKYGAVQRYFLAVDDTMYNAFDETYGGPNNSLTYNKEGKIEVNPQPLYKFDAKTHICLGENGNYYYKCPCGRNPKDKKSDVDCYRCKLCYTRNEKQNGIYYVLVNAHGAKSNDYGGIVSNFGYSRNYFKNLEKIESDKAKAERKNGEKKQRKLKVAESTNGIATLKEGLNRNYSIALQQIGRNCIYSIKKHLNTLATGENDE